VHLHGHLSFKQAAALTKVVNTSLIMQGQGGIDTILDILR